MNFNDHSKLKGLHAYLGCSQYHWINYSPEKLEATYNAHMARQKGTELHEFASKCIELKQRLPRSNKTLNKYVNDAIGFRMQTEQILYFSENCFGTADSISFRNNQLRIHDLKTGETKAHMEQLMLYAALFCLEYNKNPTDIFIELRIYQYNDILVLNTDNDTDLSYTIRRLMDIIISSDNIIEKIKERNDGYV